MHTTSDEGFFLIELMVYVSMSIFLIGCMHIFFHSFIMTIKKHSGQCASMIQEDYIHSCLRRDIQSAPALLDFWNCSSDSIMWDDPQHKKTICWQQARGKLIRKEGVYNHASHRWANAHSVYFYTKGHSYTFKLESSDKSRSRYGQTVHRVYVTEHKNNFQRTIEIEPRQEVVLV